MDMNLSELRDVVKDSAAWRAAVHGGHRVGYNWATEQQRQQQSLSGTALAKIRLFYLSDKHMRRSVSTEDGLVCFYLFGCVGFGCSTWDLHCIVGDLSFWGTDSLVVAYGLSCSVACRILVPQPGIKPECPVLHGGFLTTRPPGECPNLFLYICI